MRLRCAVAVALAVLAGPADAKIGPRPKVIACGFAHDHISMFDLGKWTQSDMPVNEIVTITDIDYATKTAKITESAGTRTDVTFVFDNGLRIFTSSTDIEYATINIVMKREGESLYPAYKVSHSQFYGKAVILLLGTCSITSE